MRTGGYTLQQSLTVDAVSIVKQAVGLARRRGHAQVTPLHVASAMLASSAGLFRRACLQSHSHPLQCKALELCFNVALNRLPTSASSPLLGPHSHLPALSNALVAAFKRAQAHQRRGSVENQQQQPILALKVEVEQLVLSILDDPSVSRVMREAGFSSTQVKTNVEQAVSLEICTNQSKETTSKLLVLGNNESQITNIQVPNDDVMSVVEAMMNKKRKNTVIVGECLATAEAVVKAVINKFDKKDVPLDLRFVQFISVPLFTLKNVSRQEYEEKLGELRSFVKSSVSRGIVLYLGDLNWVSEYWSKYGEQRNIGYYCPVEYMIMEISRLVSGDGENKKLWIMGIATFQTYNNCKNGSPSLETLWNLHPLAIPVGTLALTLNLESDLQLKSKAPVDGSNWLFHKAGVQKYLTCCSDCMVNFKREARGLMNDNMKSTTTCSSSSLPSWLQQYKDENRNQTDSDQEFDKIKDLSKKWNSICKSVHRQPHFLEKMFNFSSLSPSSSDSISSNTSSSEASGDHMDFLLKFKEFNSENMNILCNALEKKVPWQRDIIPGIVSTILKCRSGLMTTKIKKEHEENREESWLFFLGIDSDGKERMAKELAKIIFGSQENFTEISLSKFSSAPRDDSTEEVSNKRARDEHGGSYFDRFADAVKDNPGRVFLLEDVDQIDYHSRKGIKRSIENGSTTLSNGEIVPLKDAIIIFSCENFGLDSRACSPRTEQNYDKIEKDQEKGEDLKQECVLLDLNIATEDEDSVFDHGILDSVDKQVVFKKQVL
ncbi:Double Clp-N motif-containing P-loop nucleoside triphosphate hydrolase superfamily protein [Abeliophyllum distichum]|uniref:Double Clp-N motif-containing P-loop nucleoside triphosphate hydrolase superfamily protein n=1 Tax=Abeliophyllum distichum TaxID=126358 RepID=A0ABD1UMS8_9LAMI